MKPGWKSLLCAVAAAVLAYAPANAKTLRYAMSTFSEETLDPTVTSIGAAVSLGGPLWDWLTELSADGKLHPRIATSWKEADDSMSWTLKLRENVKFHDGSPLTADDVRFSLMAFSRPEAKASRARQFKRLIKDIEVVDPHTLRIVLTAPWPTLPYDVSTQAGVESIVLPKAYIERVGWSQFARQPIGSGAWKFVRHEAGNVMEFDAFKDYWGAKPKFDKLQLVLAPEESTRIAMLRSGQVDMADVSTDAVSELEKSNFGIVADPQPQSVRIHLYATWADPAMPTADVRVRKALNLAINRDEMLKGLFNGRGRVAAVFPAGPLTIGFPADLKPYPYDPKQAKQLLVDAGYANGFEITLFALSVSGFNQHQQVAETVAGYWNEIGVRTKIQLTDFGAFRPMFLAYPPNKQLIGQGSIFASTGRLNGSEDLGIWWSREHGNMRMGAKEEVDSDYLAAVKSKTPEEMAKHVSDGYHAIYNSYRGIPLVDVVGAVWAYGNQVAGIDTVNPFRGYITPNLVSARPKP